MYGMVGSSGGTGGGTRTSRDRSLSRRSRRSFNQYRQSSTFSINERSSQNVFTRTGSSTSAGKRPILNRSVSVIGTRSTEGVSNRNSSARTLYEGTERNDERFKETKFDGIGIGSKTELNEGEEEEGGQDQNSNSASPKRPRRSRRSHRSIYRRIFTLIKQAWTGVSFGSDTEEDEIEREPRHRPDDINRLCRTTHFTRSELQRLYRAFKDRCPTGLVTETAFKEMYCQMFPRGACVSQYAHYVFLTLDRQGEGMVNFEDLITLLSRLCRGSLADRLCWIFSLYDLNNDGFISRTEMLEVVQAVYDLLGKHTTVPVDGQTVEEKVTLLFETFDTNKDDLISLEEFIDACSKDLTLLQNLDAMGSYL